MSEKCEQARKRPADLVISGMMHESQSKQIVIEFLLLESTWYALDSAS
jgi:hypothetical protein